MLGLIGSAIGAVGSIIGANKDRKAAGAATAAANAASLASQQGQNEFQVQIMQQERAWDAEDNLYNEQQIDKMNAYNSPEQIRARAESAGFNPLVFAGAGAGLQGGSPIASAGGGRGVNGPVQAEAAPVISNGIAEASQLLGDGFNTYAASVSEAAKLRQQNDLLRERLTKASLRPAVGGIYGGGDVPMQGVVVNKLGKPSKSAEKEGEIFGPPSPVRLYNTSARKWVNIHPSIAKRLELQDGDAILAEDYEAIHGDVGSEFINTPNLANEILGSSHTYPSRGLRSTTPTGGSNNLPQSPKISGPKSKPKSNNDWIRQHFEGRVR